MPADFIHIANSKPFSKGGNRLCFVHPNDPGCCLKVFHDRGRPEQRRTRKGWIGYLRPLDSFDENLQERRVLQRLHRHFPSSVTRHLPKSRGLCETDLGRAHAMDLVRDHDGKISQTLEQHLWHRGMDPAAREAIEEFEYSWTRGAPQTRDLLPHNLLIRLSDSGARLILVDGYGKDSRFFRLRRLLKPDNQPALEKLAARNQTVLERKDGKMDVKARIHILDRTQ